MRTPARLVAALLSMVLAQQSSTSASGSDRPSPPHRSQRASWWDLNCEEGHRSTSAKASECVLTVRLRGRMERVRLRQVQYALERRDEAVRSRGRDVALHLDVDSEGGEIFSAMEIGRLLRKASASLSVPRGSRCISACVLVMMGATTRSVGGNARLGIHRPSLRDVDDPALVDTMKESMDFYAGEMTGSHRIVDDMMTIPSESVRYLTPGELAGYGIAVTVIRTQPSGGRSR